MFYTYGYWLVITTSHFIYSANDFSSKRPSAEECHEHRWLLPTEYMIKKRERTLFSSFKLQVNILNYEF